ncbi:hypothetical protein [Mesorhizobium sp. LNJC405B00]|uniref:hypothetical protein n=1 Tax=Mesorhizobium sp. LNJC405B00 TaxID=1287281 RepID=UPI0004CF2E9B|nr:hypothetical protein [Mesorhizobium sp. LNJC405B00]
MGEDEKNGVDEAGLSLDKKLGVKINGRAYFPLDTLVANLNPCAGKIDGTSCGTGCVCRAGQCYYTLFQLEQKGFSVK